MDYEKKYKDAQKWVESIYSELSHEHQMEAEAFFPELKESEDERIRKAILELVRQSSEVLDRQNQNNMIAWLEKQGEPTDINPSEFDLRLNRLLKQFETLPKEELASSLSFYLNVIQNDGAYKPDGKQGEQKPADKVEPKFKVGDWVVDEEDNYVYQVIRVISNVSNGLFSYDLTDSGYFYSTKTNCHLWTIKDAKDGDVLASNRSIFIFSQEYIAGKPEAHCGIMNGLFIAKSEGCWTNEECYPATKSQRDTLFAKMKEAGYEWDAEKKELKKISQRMVSAEAKEDIYDNPAWSEEDEKMIGRIRSIVEKYAFSQSAVDANGDLCEEEYIDADNWLKSLKERYTWKPGEEQLECLYDAINHYQTNGYPASKLNELYEQMSKIYKL